jgi:hypothetical protein
MNPTEHFEDPLNQIYLMAPDGSYHGGYRLNPVNLTENKYLGGNPQYMSRFENNVVPFGLFHEKTVEGSNDSNGPIYGGLVNDDLFDKLFLSVGKIEKSNKTHSFSKTRKNSNK